MKNWAKHIAKLISLIAVLLLLAGSRYAHAQNTGAAPYLDSEHDYQVKIGKPGNHKYWVVTDNPVESGTNTYTFENGVSDEDWFTFPGGEPEGHQRVKIYFDRDVFAPGEVIIENWRLRYYEFEDIYGDGSLECISAREFIINISENTFYFTVDDDNSVCNVMSGEVRLYADVETASFQTEVSYGVSMHKNDDYTPNHFYFEAHFSQAPVNNSFSVNVDTEIHKVTVNYENLEDDIYGVTVYHQNNEPFLDEVPLEIIVRFNNPVLENTAPELTLMNGRAVIHGNNGNPPAITYDNEAIYPTDDPGHRKQTVTILEIPATRDIQPGAGETAWSASNPLQNSTHNYSVQMESATDNQANDLTGWHITRAGSEVEIEPGEGTYQIVSDFDDTENTADAQITFSFAHDDAEGNIYVLHFTEQNGEDCSTTRPYTITIQAPFDVDIAAIDDNCSGASNKIYADVTAEETTIIYTVNLKSPDYEASWQFNLVLQCNELNGTTLLAPDANISVSGGILGSITRDTDAHTVTIPVAVIKAEDVDVSKQVLVTVNYIGIYATAHTITANLVPPATPGSFGSYGEVDIDDGITLADDDVVEGEINQAQHTIYAMPQPGELAGVD